MPELVWFRSDLRTRDHSALHAAAKASQDGVIGVFVICPKQWQGHDWGDIKVNFLLRTLTGLSDALRRLKIPLLIRRTADFSGVPKVLQELAVELDCGGIWFNREYEVNERERDEAVTQRFEAHDLDVHAFTDQVILPPGDVRTKEGHCYLVYTPFRRRWVECFDEGEPMRVLNAPRKQEPVDIKPDDVPGSVKGFGAFDRPDLWPAGESEALKRLKSFTDSGLDRYKDRRDTPSVDGTSRLSHHLAIGSISPRQCLHAALDGKDRVSKVGKKAFAWINELVWREFYKHLIVAHPRVCRYRAFKPETEDLQWRVDDDGFEAWCEGRTGFPIVDAAMRQLNQTGWMHNRLRMITASFLTKDLLIDWRRGERYFMHHLIDGDLASNNGGWQWAASTGTDAQPYFRVFNPTTQGRRYDPEGRFIRKFVPELESLDKGEIHEPAKKGDDWLEEAGYPAPIVDHKEARQRALDAFKATSDDD